VSNGARIDRERVIGDSSSAAVGVGADSVGDSSKPQASQKLWSDETLAPQFGQLAEVGPVSSPVAACASLVIAPHSSWCLGGQLA
jgi:hypothetical protein